MAILELIAFFIGTIGMTYMLGVSVFFFLTYMWVWLRYFNTKNGPFKFLTWLVGVDSNAV